MCSLCYGDTKDHCLEIAAKIIAAVWKFQIKQKYLLAAYIQSSQNLTTETEITNSDIVAAKWWFNC